MSLIVVSLWMRLGHRLVTVCTVHMHVHVGAGMWVPACGCRHVGAPACGGGVCVACGWVGVGGLTYRLVRVRGEDRVGDGVFVQVRARNRYCVRKRALTWENRLGLQPVPGVRGDPRGRPAGDRGQL